jgi:hypothetical protein
VYIGQDVTIVGYVDPVNPSFYPGEAYEAHLEVTNYWERGFWYPGGAYTGLSLSIGLDLHLLDFG